MIYYRSNTTSNLFLILCLLSKLNTFIQVNDDESTNNLTCILYLYLASQPSVEMVDLNIGTNWNEIKRTQILSKNEFQKRIL